MFTFAPQELTKKSAKPESWTTNAQLTHTQDINPFNRGVSLHLRQDLGNQIMLAMFKGTFLGCLQYMEMESLSRTTARLRRMHENVKSTDQRLEKRGRSSQSQPFGFSFLATWVPLLIIDNCISPQKESNVRSCWPPLFCCRIFGSNRALTKTRFEVADYGWLSKHKTPSTERASSL